MKMTAFILLILTANLSYAKNLSCAGTEPFWGAKINTQSGLILLADPNTLSQITLHTNIKAAAGTTTEYAFHATDKNIAVSVIGNETCSDGMSDQKYSYSIMVMGLGKSSLVGCCK